MDFTAEIKWSRSGLIVLNSDLVNRHLCRVRTRGAIPFGLSAPPDGPDDPQKTCRVTGNCDGIWIDLMIHNKSKGMLSVDGKAFRSDEEIRVGFWSEQGEFLGESHVEIHASVDSLTLRMVARDAPAEVLAAGRLVFRHPSFFPETHEGAPNDDSALARLTEELWEQYKSQRLVVPKPWHNMIFGPGRLTEQLIRKIHEASRINATIAINGPTGAGKELVAKAIHDLSGRKGHWVAVNCATFDFSEKGIPLSKLFGLGEASGLVNVPANGEPGLFAQADGGTLFLDEIHTLPRAVQAALLRVLDGYGYSPAAGRYRMIFNDVRLIVATNMDLKSLVVRGQFSRELLYRIGSFELNVPFLCQRRADIVLLLAHLLRGTGRTCAKDLFSALLWYSWPGNVRELLAVIEGIKTVSPGEVNLLDLRSTILNGGIVEALEGAYHRRRHAKQRLGSSTLSNPAVNKLVALSEQLFPTVFNHFKSGHPELVLGQIAHAHQVFGQFLIDQRLAAPGTTWRGAAFDMLKQIFPEKKALATLRASFKRLQELHVKVSSCLEDPRYSTVVLFFGVTFEKLRHDPRQGDDEYQD